MATNHSLIELTNFFPSAPYRLAYALPLFALSALLTFAGAFLTLDRTRSFRPRSEPLHVSGSFNLTEKPKRVRFYLQGGLGGVAIGYSFGLHLSTFLALVVPNETTSTPLGPKSFLAVWVLTSIPFAILSGLFEYAAFALTGITGGLSLALALSVSMHPNLLTRRVFLALLVTVSCFLTVAPFARTQRKAIRLSASAAGTFGLTMSIALLAHVRPWSNVWERLWISDGNGWGTGAERALCAGYWLILIAGCSADWAFKRYFGGNPDEEWDTYLAEYTSSLPISHGRSGIFRPLSYGFWDRLFPWMRKSRPSGVPDDLFSPDDKYTRSPRLSFDFRQAFDQPAAQPVLTLDGSPRLLRKQTQPPLARLQAFKHAGGHRKREVVKFGVTNPDDLSSDDEDDPLSAPPPLPRRISTLSSVTLTNVYGTGSRGTSTKGDREQVAFAKRAALRGNDDSAPAYSDYEEDVTNAQTLTEEHRDSPDWKPPFLARHASNAANPAAPVGAVPITPSLIRAVNRIAAAQAQAYGSSVGPDSSTVTLRGT
ncbi:hypothetical protein BC826DRAFT_1107896 [Russula brevipes]|nr:hypothetical protein BC826DRAFT_1107896 [Russula brevipes]